jgi:hypothetical protein
MPPNELDFSALGRKKRAALAELPVVQLASRIRSAQPAQNEK